METVLENCQKLRTNNYLEKISYSLFEYKLESVRNQLEISFSRHFYSFIVDTNLLYLATLVLKLSLFLEKRVDEVHRFRR